MYAFSEPSVAVSEGADEPPTLTKEEPALSSSQVHVDARCRSLVPNKATYVGQS